jgi:AraC family transcriptional regulator
MMNPVDRALWYIESNLHQPLVLADIAGAAQVSSFHLTRAFALRTGYSVMRFVWKRRLTQAAQRSARGEGPILHVALDALYTSHEAFTRAFKAEFGHPPNRIRTADDLTALGLLGPQPQRTDMPKFLTAPATETMPARLFAGLSKRYTMETRFEIPAQWGEYDAQGHQSDHVIPDNWYGVCYNFSDDHSFDYLCGQEVTARTPLPQGWTHVALTPGRFARFATKGHISTMTQMWSEIYEDWLTRPDLKPRPGPSVEFYPAEFDGATGEGGFEIWVPVE